MTAIALTLPALRRPAPCAQHWRAALLVLATLAALWVVAGFSLALHGGRPSLNSPPPRAGAGRQPAARLQRRRPRR